ncbi:MAG: Ig-like domain-containing protein, partial [Candidatus Dormibacteria bacterium]
MSRHAAPRRRVAAATAGVVALLAGVTLSVASTPVADATAGPFTCTPGFFQVTSGLLNKLDPVTGVYTPVGSAYSDTYNAMGYDTLNNYLYAIDTGTDKGDLLRIASDGSVTNLGTPTGYPAGTTSVAGDFDGNGDLIVQDSATIYYSINVATMTATKLTITGSTQSVDDLVWIGGYMYGLTGENPVVLLVVDLSTGVATEHDVSGITSTDGAFGAGFSDQPDDLFFSDNSGQGIYSLSGYTTSTPSATYEAPGAVTGNNDGAACKLAGSPFAGPTANPDSYSPLAGQAFSVDAAGGVLANDTGSEPLTVDTHTAPSHGTLTLNGDGSLTYTPTGTYSGPDSFTYVAEDPYGRTSSPATVSLSVLPAPQNQTDTTALDTAYTQAAPGLLTGAVGSSLSLVSNTDPAHGTVSVTDSTGAFTYTPDTDWSGVDTFTFTVADLYDQTATATVTMDVPPSVQPAAYTASGTSPLVVAAPGPLAGDAGTGLTVTSHTTPGHGSVTTSANGSFTYTAAAGFSGTDTFQYTATDSSGLTGTATVTVQVTPASGSPAYTTPAGTLLSVAAAQGVVAASDGSGLTATETAAPSHGSLSLSATGAFTYTPAPGYSGDDGFGFEVTDSHGQQASGTASIVVTPVADPDSGTTPYDTQLSVAAPGVLGNDVGVSLTVTGHTTPSHGTVTVNPDGAYVYTPHAGYVGTDSFQYTIEDQAASPATAAVTITVTQVATSFTASADPATTTYGSTVQLMASGLPANATGAVTFTSGGSTLCTSGQLSSGAASCTTAVLVPGTHDVTATYAGDTGYLGSTASTSFTIGRASTSFTASADPSSASYGSTIQLTASGLPSGATGTVTFTSGGSTLCTSGELSSGSASCTTGVLTAASYPVTATYAGDTNYLGSTASTGFSIGRASTSFTASA